MPNASTKDPGDRLDYAWDFNGASPGPWLAVGETITAKTVTATPTGLTVETPSESGGKVTAFITGGTSGTVYAVTCHITTSTGRQVDRTYQITVADL